MNQKAFWPSVYKVNINRYPDVLAHYGNANQVMRAEKRYIWDSLHYGDECAVLDATECRNSVETRHKSGAFAKKPAFKKCRYKSNGTCAAAVVKYAKSLQFMRWLLNEVDPQAFREYVRQFPHQLTEVNYGYNVEENNQYIPVDVVEELQDEILPQPVEEIDIAQPVMVQYQSVIVPANSAANAKRSTDNGKLRECIRNNKTLEVELQEREEDAERYAEQYANEAEEHSALKRRFRELAKDLSDSKLTIKELIDELDEARRYAVDCAKDRLALRDLRKQMTHLSSIANVDLTNADVQRAFRIMQSTIGKNVLQSLQSANGAVEVTGTAQEIKTKIQKLQRVMSSDIEPTKKAAALIKFYVKLFNDQGLLTEITSTVPSLQRAKTMV